MLLRFSNYISDTDGAGAFANYPGPGVGDDVAGDVQFNRTYINSNDMLPGSYSYFATIHELGHALGLAHPGDYNAEAGETLTYTHDAQAKQDSQQYTVMSYFDGAATGANFLGRHPQTLMMADIYAIQQLYGANLSTRSGSTIYGFHSTLAGSVYDFATNRTPVLCIWDAGGTDSIDASGFSQTQRIDLRPGAFSNIGGGAKNVSVAVGTTIERAVGGAGRDTIIGNSSANRLTANNGNDSLNGGAGHDTLDGGGGRDHFVFTLAPGSTNFDIITTFARGQDKIDLNSTVFSGVEKHSLNHGESVKDSEIKIVTSGHAASAGVHLIYNKTDGSLWYDANGVAGGEAEIAVLANKPTTLNHFDFALII